ncbi:MAG: hypothetical protein M1820_005000 [Bogoriella megaspora]|nr:MAG: hypothetical protein M1820_005000 [Bogoriella megaspora]
MANPTSTRNLSTTMGLPFPEEVAWASTLSVYDAVAGRITQSGHRRKYFNPTGVAPLLPEDVLFRSSRAPLRYEEDDVYFQNEKLPENRKLPDPDLLKALHAYASDYYFCTSPNNGATDFRSMDETALLALGILIEEAAVQALGPSGDMLFTEADDEHERRWPTLWVEKEHRRNLINFNVGPPIKPKKKRKKRDQKRKATGEESSVRKRKKTTK